MHFPAIVFLVFSHDDQLLQDINTLVRVEVFFIWITHEDMTGHMFLTKHR